MKYTAKVVKEIDHGEDYWNTLKIGVFQGKKQIGFYERDYSSLYNTFYPFNHEGKWYALYSDHYEDTRIMELPSCKDITKKHKSIIGFCPVDFYVPNYFEYNFDIDGKNYTGVISQITEKDYKKEKITEKDVKYHKFGFVSGCFWGDDSSWKIRYIDLSKAAKGVIKMDDRFGYIEMPENINRLYECINVLDYDNEESPMVEIAIAKTFNIKMRV